MPINLFISRQQMSGFFKKLIDSCICDIELESISTAVNIYEIQCVWVYNALFSTHLSLGCRNDLNNSYTKHLIKCGRNKCWVLLFIDLEFNFCIARTHALKPAIYEHILNYLLSFRILRGQFVARVYKRTHTNTLITSPKSALVRWVGMFVCVCVR